MNATILPNSEKHYPVLLKEILSIISPQNGGTFIDCTFGQGGYSKEFLKFKKQILLQLIEILNVKSLLKNLNKFIKNDFFF